MKTSHRMKWQCLATDHEPFLADSSEEFEQHMKMTHAGDFPADELSFLAEISCQPISPIIDCCPFCNEISEQSPDLDIHIGEHLQEVALYSLRAPGSVSSGEGASLQSPSDSGSQDSNPDTRSTIKDLRQSAELPKFHDSDDRIEPSRWITYCYIPWIETQHQEMDTSVLLQRDYTNLVAFACAQHNVSDLEALLQLLSAPSADFSASAVSSDLIDPNCSPAARPSAQPTASDAASSPSQDVDSWSWAYKIFQEREPELAADYAKHLTSLQGDTAASIVLSVPRSVESIVTQLLEDREKKQWRVSLLGRDIKIRGQAEKLAKFLLWSDPIVKDALSAQPYAALAWSGVSLLLPVSIRSSQLLCVY
jgi:hypothetical protein